MAGPATRQIDGKYPGWNGLARHYVAVTKSDATVYEPPLRLLITATEGAVVLVLDGDDETACTLSAVTPTGTTPPAVMMSGTPVAAVSTLLVDIVVGGARGTATFRWSIDNGATYSSTVATAASVELTGSGLTANFPVGTYNADNLYTATSSNPAWFTVTTTAAQREIGELAIRQVRSTGTTAANMLGYT